MMEEENYQELIDQYHSERNDRKNKERKRYQKNIRKFVEKKTLGNIKWLKTQARKFAKMGKSQFKVCGCYGISCLLNRWTISEIKELPKILQEINIKIVEHISEMKFRVDLNLQVIYAAIGKESHAHNSQNPETIIKNQEDSNELKLGFESDFLSSRYEDILKPDADSDFWHEFCKTSDPISQSSSSSSNVSSNETNV